MKTNWTAGIVAAMALSADKSWSAYTSDQLKDSLLKELTNSLPKMEVLTCQIESGIISQDPSCASAQNAAPAALSASLTALFSKDTYLDWNTNQGPLTAAAKAVAADLLGPPGGPPPVIDRHKLAVTLNSLLSTNLPKSLNLDSQTIAQESGVIAGSCGGAPNSSALLSALVTALENDPKFNLAADPVSAGTIAVETLKAMNPSDNPPIATAATPVSAPPPIPIDAGSPANRMAVVNFWTGSKFLSPYSINPSTMALQSSGNSSAAFIEIAFDQSYIFRSGIYRDLNLFGQNHRTNSFQVFWPAEKMPDFSGKFGYVFNNNSSTNISASTIAGNSDIYSEASFGLPLLRYDDDGTTRFQVDLPQLSGGYSTDKQFDHVHPDFFVGAGFQAKFPNILSQTNYPIYWLAQVGMGMIDVPKITAGGVAFQQNGGLSEPMFQTAWEPAIGTSLIIPVPATALSLEVGGDAYFSSGPGNWDITLGVSLDLSKFAKGLGSALGASQ